MDKELETLAALGIKTTSFKTFFVKNNIRQGTPLAQGECKAVRLQIKKYDVYTETPTTTIVAWYGDSGQQSKELLANSDNHGSDLIICSDLSQVWLRCFRDTYFEVTIYN